MELFVSVGGVCPRGLSCMNNPSDILISIKQSQLIRCVACLHSNLRLIYWKFTI